MKKRGKEIGKNEKTTNRATNAFLSLHLGQEQAKQPHQRIAIVKPGQDNATVQKFHHGREQGEDCHQNANDKYRFHKPYACAEELIQCSKDPCTCHEIEEFS